MGSNGDRPSGGWGADAGAIITANLAGFLATALGPAPSGGSPPLVTWAEHGTDEEYNAATDA
jgi:hypothetical protein